MKKLRFILSFLFMLFLCACNKNGSAYESGKIRISIKDSEFFTASDATALIDYASDYTTTLTMRNGYVISSVSYEDYLMESLGDDVYSITFKCIKRPVRIKIFSNRADGFKTENEAFTASIRYFYNDGSDASEMKSYELSYHIRANTWNARNLKRDGYTLTGWNTEPDGTGLHIGLGSRVSVTENETLSLYAEWVKWTDVSEFLYKRTLDDEIYLSGYKGSGDDECLCLPEYIHGCKVTKVLNSFTQNMPCGKITSKTLIIPNTITEIENSAFSNTEFEDIYFSDNLSFAGYGCFGYNIRHYHLEAYLNPKLEKSNYNVRFADNIDLLIKYSDEKKIVLYGGCNFAYGMYSPMMEEAFSEYKVINCGLNGEFNSLFQMEIIESFLSEGDIFIHAPEQMNGYQFLSKLLVDSRIFAMVEGNYDLFAIADFSYSPFIIESYTDYNALRSENEDCTYEDEPGMFNTYGDYLEDRNYSEINEAIRDVSYTENWRYDASLLDGDNISLLGGIYNDIASKGVKVYFTHAPMNGNSSEEEVIYEKAREFQDVLKDALKDYDVTIISEITDYIYSGRFFFDTDYHLNFYGAELRTEQLISDLKKAGVK